MLIVLPFCQKDKDAALRLLDWISQLGSNNWHHTSVLVAAASVPHEDLMQAIVTAKGIFGAVLGVRQNQADERGWPMSSNALFRTAVDYIEREACSPFLWLEPDCVPLVPDWLSIIEKEYKESGKLFMGAIHNRPHRHLAACSVYPANVREINPNALKTDTAPWDLVDSEKTLEHTHSTNLIQHYWGEAKAPPSFKEPASLAIINPAAVLFHRNKDGTLINTIRRKLKIPERKDKGSLILRRSGAHGDAIAASVVALRLQELGFNVTYQAVPDVHVSLRRINPVLNNISHVNGSCHINLDEAYEKDPKRKQRTIAESYFDRANEFAARHGIKIGSSKNWAVRMSATQAEKAFWTRKLRGHLRPWVMICPRSNSHLCRSVPDSTWKRAAEQIDGTKFWLGSHAPAPQEIQDLRCRSMDDIIGAISVADLLLTTDTGPMHIGAALGIPLIAIEQAVSPEYRLSDQRDWVKVSPDLKCLNCHATKCPINAADPPCQYVQPEVLAAAANRRLRVGERDVSIAIAIYKPPAQRINRCLTAAIPQAKEIVVVWDQAGVMPLGAMQHEKVRYYRHWQHDIGYGRKANFAMRHTSSKWVLLLNDDCYLWEGAIDRLMECATPDVGIISALLFYPNGKIQHGGTVRAPGQHGWFHLDVNQSESRFKEPVEMENVTGACVLINRDAFYEAGGFDEEFYLCCEDADLCMKIRQAGYRVMFTPHAKGTHEESVSSRLTPNFLSVIAASNARLEKKWAWYWDKNRDVPLGTF